MFNTTSNNISVISWWTVLLEEETRVQDENHRPAASHWQTKPYEVEIHLNLSMWTPLLSSHLY